MVTRTSSTWTPGSLLIPGFAFPATLEDGGSATAYKGKIPMGSLLMLPTTYDTSKITSPGLYLNRLSMRGPWNAVANGGTFDSWRQALVFPKTTAVVTQTQTHGTGARRLSWAPWTAGATFRFTVIATGGAKLNMQFKDGSYNTVLETGSLGNGESKTFVMPAANGWAVLIARSGIGEESSVRATLVAE